MKFWKFEGRTEAQIEEYIQNRCLPPLDAGSPGRTNTNAPTMRRMRPEDGVVLGTLEGTEAILSALGCVREIDPTSNVVAIDWVRIDLRVSPNPQGGLANWRQKSAFEISPSPAQRYGLPRLFARHFDGDV